MRIGAPLALTLFASMAAAQVLDRVAAVVGKDVITESEVLEELRITAFLNGEKLTLSAESKRAAAERLVDQTLIRHEISASRYRAPSEQEVNGYFNQFMRQRFSSEADLRRALYDYGLTESELRKHLAWQISALQFTSARFGTDGSDVDQQMEAWLKQAREQNRIEFKKEALS